MIDVQIDNIKDVKKAMKQIKKEERAEKKYERRENLHFVVKKLARAVVNVGLVGGPVAGLVAGALTGNAALIAAMSPLIALNGTAFLASTGVAIRNKKKTGNIYTHDYGEDDEFNHILIPATIQLAEKLAADKKSKIGKDKKIRDEKIKERIKALQKANVIPEKTNYSEELEKINEYKVCYIKLKGSDKVQVYFGKKCKEGWKCFDLNKNEKPFIINKKDIDKIYVTKKYYSLDELTAALRRSQVNKLTKKKSKEIPNQNNISLNR